MPLPSRPMFLATVEAMKTVLSLGLGTSIVADVALAKPNPNFIVRPLRLELPCTLGLIERRDKPNGPVLFRRRYSD
jgi:hypothetical protein